MRSAQQQKKLYLAAAVILCLGLGSALLIFLTAGGDADGAVAYETAGGTVYTVRPEDSKMYIHDLELYGGKVNVLANDFRRWFTGLWHGRSLAVTISGITLVVSLGCLLAARSAPHAAHTAAGRNELDSGGR